MCERMTHRLRLPEVRRTLLRELQQIDGPAFTTQEAAAMWDLDGGQTEEILETMDRVGLLEGKPGDTDRIWWATELALYDVTCAATP